MAQHEAGAALFEVSVGNLTAGVAVEVRFAYLRLLECFGGTLEWSHVATWVPPYLGSAGDRATGLEKVGTGGRGGEAGKRDQVEGLLVKGGEPRESERAAGDSRSGRKGVQGKGEEKGRRG